MNKFLRPFYACGLMLAAFNFVSCDDSDSDINFQEQKDNTLLIANVQFVEKTVIPTYKNLADKSIELQEVLESLTESKTDAKVKQACQLWIDARQYWEWSEAFLFGAASKYYIDPHIDTWPLDKTALENLLNSDKMMEDIDNTIANLNNGLVGFHGLEYIIFREGQPRSASIIEEKELKYAIAVAKDLTLSCCRVEAAWAGMENVTKERQEIIEEAEMEPEDNFGEQMRLSGKAGSVWKSVTAGSEQILEGCKTIVDEVGNSKIGKPFHGEDESYIESPHVYNSIQDFSDNIISVRNVYYGGLGAKSVQSGSLSEYIKSVDSAVDAKLIAAIEDCLAKINDMPKPFVLNYKNAAVEKAIDACGDLEEALEAARKVLVQD